jgi:2-phospho-L-lactate guanylyltransferase
MSDAIVVPIKSPKGAKNRLEAILTEREREALAWAMAEDVLRTARQAPADCFLAVSDDDGILSLARDLGFEPLRDDERQGQSAAARQGFEAAWERDCSTGLTIPGDVPAVSVEELRLLLAFRPEVEVVLAADRQGEGTNGLRLTPPDAIDLRFGEDSFSLHRMEAERMHRSFEVLSLERLAVDLDRPDDLRAFLTLEPAGKTLALLHRLGVPERLAAGVRRR